MTNFWLYNEQTINGLRQNTWASVFCFLWETAVYKYKQMYGTVCIYVYIYMYRNGTNGKWKFVFLGWQTINGNRWLLCQQMFPSIVINLIYKVYYDSVHNIKFNIFWHWPIQVCIQHSVFQHSMLGIFDVQFINAQSYRTQCWVTVFKHSVYRHSAIDVHSANAQYGNLFLKVKAKLPACSRRSRRGLVQEDKRMAFVYTHGLFIT